MESRAHNAWLEARAARREADAARDEAAALRRKLASLSAASPLHSESHIYVGDLDSIPHVAVIVTRHCFLVSRPQSLLGEKVVRTNEVANERITN